jgi:hypothetical protein
VYLFFDPHGEPSAPRETPAIQKEYPAFQNRKFHIFFSFFVITFPSWIRIQAGLNPDMQHCKALFLTPKSHLKVLSSEMDPAEIRLIIWVFYKERQRGAEVSREILPYPIL